MIPEAKKMLFVNFDVQRVRNGFILTLDRNNSMVSDNVYVFNSLKDLSEFIKDLDNTK